MFHSSHSEPAGSAPASYSSELYTIPSRLIASVVQLAALASISKAVLAACNSEYASSEGQGDAAAYQTRWHRLRAGQDRPGTSQ